MLHIRKKDFFAHATNALLLVLTLNQTSLRDIKSTLLCRLAQRLSFSPQKRRHSEHYIKLVHGHLNMANYLYYVYDQETTLPRIKTNSTLSNHPDFCLVAEVPY